MKHGLVYLIIAGVLLVAILTLPPFAGWVAELLRIAGNRWHW